ncbi:GDSL-type esterase/lipase family protein [Marinobacter sp. CHS3-4]|uniref:GDSL-type esterase/lipase family protein n=1 Tax=Marinobacter sp. CHS3-4 TaxID=3045174 RepID=UPI0024B5AE69|nr:GDSL-type esterase/lipase family protein [Marinobacter sp. CHS3-4]MDI9244741.1 arylesterase [Marinobacter sp. CHS3-4]
MNAQHAIADAAQRLRMPVLLALFLLITACSDSSPRYQPLAQDSVVLAFGNSVTHGTGAGKGEDFPSLLAKDTGWTVVNAGIPGDTAREARGRIGGLLQKHEPDLVIVELGGNDFLRRQSANQVKEHLREIITAVRRSGAIPALVAVPEFSVFGASVGSLSDSPIYAELAEEERILLIDGIFSEVLSDEGLRADRIHPNASGYRKMADGIAAALTEAGLKPEISP